MKAVYPGSFDPITNGHLDIIERASKLVDTLVVAVLKNSSKEPLFSIDERIELIKESTKHIPNLIVEPFCGLLIDFAKKTDSKVIIRGLRAVSDYEYELQMALANKKMYKDIETLFMVSNTKFSFLSSSLVKEIAAYDGDLSDLVPEIVIKKLKSKI